MKFQKIFFGAALALCAHGTLIRAQETRAVITGTVTDPQGASVPAARLDIRNLETNVVTRTQTNGSGIYTAPPINPGQYSVTVTAAGFKVAVENNLELRSSDRKAVDFTLQLGTASETISITTTRSASSAGVTMRSCWMALRTHTVRAPGQRTRSRLPRTPSVRSKLSPTSTMQNWAGPAAA